MGVGAAPAQPAAAAQPTATAQPITANGSATWGTNTSMDEDREREQRWYMRFGGPKLGEAEEWKWLLEKRQLGVHDSTPPGQVEVGH